MKYLITLLFLIFCHSTNAQERTKITVDSFINKWLGKPYRFGGNSNKGIDCSALAQKFYSEVLDFTIPRTCVYQMKHSIKGSIDSLKTGDILFFKSKYSPSGNHCGIYLYEGLFIHAANYKLGVIISCIYDEKYINNLKQVGYYNKSVL